MKKSLFMFILILFYAGASFCYSGLIIDTTNSSDTAKLGHTVMDHPKTLLNKITISEDINKIIDKGLICYTGSVDAAKRSGFVGKDPLIVRAVYRFDDKKLTDIIILPEEAEEILNVADNAGYLGNLKIAIIL